MLYAYIDNGVVREIKDVNGDIKELFHPDMLWVECSKNVEVGYLYENSNFKSPVEQTQTLSKEEIEEMRLIAYANPVTGIDRYFAEVLSLQAEGFTATSPEVKEAKAKGLSRKSEIQALYPYPVE